MKRFIVSLVAVGFAAMPLNALAATLVSGQQYSLPVQQTITGNLYAAAGSATFGGRVTGDAMVAGGTVSLSGAVNGDVTAVGGVLQVLGPVDGSVRGIGSAVSVNDRVGGDLVLAGATVHILPTARVQGDVVVAAGQVIVDGAVLGSIRMVGGELIINGTVDGGVYARVSKRVALGQMAKISGDLNYHAPQRVQMADGAAVGGTVTYQEVAAKSNIRTTQVPKGILIALFAAITAFGMLAMLGFTALLVWRWRRNMVDVLSQVYDDFLPSLGRGLVYGIAIPIAAVLLLVSIVGIFPGLLLILLYGAGIIVTKVLAGVLFGSWLDKIIGKRAALRVTWLSALGGVIALQIVSLIPIVGWLIGIALSIAVFGALAQNAKRHLFMR